MADINMEVFERWLPEQLKNETTLGLLKVFGSVFVDLHGIIKNVPSSIDPKSNFYALTGDVDEDREKEEFLKWLSGWMSLSQDEGWTYEKQREILINILPLYKKRGTIEGLTEYLRIYAGISTAEISIIDDQPPIVVDEYESSIIGVNMVIGGFPPITMPMVIEERSIVNKNSIIEGFPPYYFFVKAAISVSGPGALSAARKAIIKILDMEKPAHTWYRLWIKGPTLQIGNADTAVLGVNTII